MAGKRYVVVGLGLLVAYLLQYRMNIHWEVLQLLQQQGWFRILSGCLIAACVGFQWYLSRIRFSQKASYKKSMYHLKLHRWMGALLPLLFYIHATVPGYAYLMVLSILFFSNILLGMLHTEVLPISKKWYYQSWIWLHVSLSCLITALIAFHVFIVIYY